MRFSGVCKNGNSEQRQKQKKINTVFVSHLVWCFVVVLIDLFYSVGRYFIDIHGKLCKLVIQKSTKSLFCWNKKIEAGTEYCIYVPVLWCFNVLKVTVLCTVHSHLSACNYILHVMRKWCSLQWCFIHLTKWKRSGIGLFLNIISWKFFSSLSHSLTHSYQNGIILVSFSRKVNGAGYWRLHPFVVGITRVSHAKNGILSRWPKAL